ncbi:hypothetical protein CO174_05475 [Candidatus Uhrbacteria bacterium CG_4_9_14_3_um_filter_50_9]|uniref:Uncharacterized protein n=1 Tax=Candidatus Uhrbacteria bacterium CG_4_9_14_3_um_filter_50_9 TaxID=1975035 RepID=A0A2M7XAX3_9BACT|nr:MAG: hypothetical protein CO174_05475 [Candidatus Uhrbacteria bacterium CG_4_9_14_3_um_filter_50_9]
MGVVREVLFGKVDLDTIATALVLGLRSEDVMFRAIGGSAASAALADSSVVAIEVGGSGRTTENNFDHHSSSGLLAGVTNLSAAAQALERLARLIRYVDELDRGDRRAEQIEGGGYPSLSQLISGMLLVVDSPHLRMEKGLEILRGVLQSGIDPYGSMESILDHIPNARFYAATKREHDRKFEEVCESATWYTTHAGHKLAVVETEWFRAPGALYGKGADIVVAPDLTVAPALEELARLEKGWGGPAHGGICGSPLGRDSGLEMETVAQIVVEKL